MTFFWKNVILDPFLKNMAEIPDCDPQPLEIEDVPQLEDVPGDGDRKLPRENKGMPRSRRAHPITRELVKEIIFVDPPADGSAS